MRAVASSVDVHTRSIGLVTLACALAACAASPPRLSPATGSKQVGSTSTTVVYRRLSGIASSSSVIADAIAAMGPSCARVPVASVVSSSSLPAVDAVDGDVATVFNSGAFMPHELTIDLTEPNVVSALVLTTEQTPAGVTTQVVEISDDGVSWSELASLRGYTTTETVYAATVRRAPRARYVRIRTIESPSWVAFREVAVVSCTHAPRATGDRVPRRAPVDRTGSRWVRGHGACERPRDCVLDDCCASTTCVPRAEAPRCEGVGCPRVAQRESVECGCRASTCGAWVTDPPSVLDRLGEIEVSPGAH